MAERLEYVKLTPEVVVDAGCGIGDAHPLLERRFPDARLVGVDPVVGLLELGPRSRVIAMLPKSWKQGWPFGAGAGRPAVVAADFEHLPFTGQSIGCIWSNLALQGVDDPVAVFAEWHRVLRAEGLVMFSTLGPDTLKELRAAWSESGRPAAAAVTDGRVVPSRPAPHVHPFIDMHDIGDMLVHAGFADPVMDMETITLTYRELDSLFADLRGAGAANSHTARARGLTGRARWAAMRRAYEAMRDGETLPATFEIIYGHAWKPEPRARPDADGVARVRIEDIGRGGRSGI